MWAIVASRQQFFEKARLQQLCIVMLEVSHAERELQKEREEEAAREEKLVRTQYCTLASRWGGVGGGVTGVTGLSSDSEALFAYIQVVYHV